MTAVCGKIASMRNRKGKIVMSAVGLSVLLAIGPVNKAYAGTKIFGWDVEASYSNIKHIVMEKVFGVSLPKIPVVVNPSQETNNKANGTNQKTTESDTKLKDMGAYTKLVFTQDQVNNLIKTQIIGKNLGNGIVVKSGKLEFLDDNIVGLTAQVVMNNDSTKPVNASAKIKVVEDGTRLKIDALDIEGLGIGAKFLKPVIVKYFESQQEALIKKYAPADFAFIEVENGLVNVYLNK